MLSIISHQGNVNQYCYTDVTISTIKIKLVMPSVGQCVEQLKHSYIANGNESGTTTLEKSLRVSYKY